MGPEVGERKVTSEIPHDLRRDHSDEEDEGLTI